MKKQILSLFLAGSSFMAYAQRDMQQPEQDKKPKYTFLEIACDRGRFVSATFEVYNKDLETLKAFTANCIETDLSIYNQKLQCVAQKEMPPEFLSRLTAACAVVGEDMRKILNVESVKKLTKKSINSLALTYSN